EVKERLPDLQPPPQLESPEQARFRLFDSITVFLKTASQKQPLVLVLDDLHWADQPSLLLLQFVARELGGSRLFVTGTYRDVDLSRQHPLAETLGELTRERLFQRVLLRGLSQEDVGRFIEVATGVTPPTGLIQVVYTQTEGNPLFVTEVVRLLVQERNLTPERTKDQDSWTVRIPEGVREVIGRRLNRLSQRCNETLTVASVIGREFTLNQLMSLVEDISEDRLLEVLEEALAARVIEELPQEVGRYQFTHALIQETLTQELTLTRRVRLHATIAQELEKMYGVDADAHAPELAHHFAEAEATLGTEKLVQYSLLAGERALASYANEEALVHFQRGLTAKKGQAMDADTAALLFGFACAQATAADRRLTQEVADSLRRAFNYYAEAGDVVRAVEVAESQVLWVGGGLSTGLAQIISRALEMVPPDSLDAGRLSVRQGEILGQDEGDYNGAQEAFDRALAVARREGDLGLEMKALASATRVDFHNNSFQKCIEEGLRAIELAHHVDDLRAELDARYYTSVALILHNGDYAGASSQGTAILSLAEQLRDRQWLTAAFTANAVLCVVTGDWAGLRDYSARGLALRPADARLLGARARSEYLVGDFDQGDAYLERLIAAAQQDGSTFSDKSHTAITIPFAARITGVWERFDIAEAMAGSILSSSSATQSRTESAHVSLALMAVVRGDAAVSGEQYLALKSVSGTMLQGGGFSADRLLGLLSHTLGNLEQAVAHFEDALSFCRKAGFRPELAWTCCDYADLLLQRNSEGDRAKAMSLLDESLALSTELGMRPLMERVLSRRDILKA
ncbi:MAG: AAA family ATPase, partial [Dehalococcoidia bacterium]